MNQHMQELLAGFAAQAEDLSKRLLKVDAKSEPALFRQLQREYSRAHDLERLHQRWDALTRSRLNAKEHLSDDSEEIRELSAQELAEIDGKLAKCEEEIRLRLLPEDPNEGRDLFLEIRAGSGGMEAALFSADLQRMYKRYADSQGWTMETISASFADQGGFREVISKIEGATAWSRLRFESGVHRVQRIPVTESQGRIHTSAASVAVLAEPEGIGEIDISPDELRIDTFRASGAGGQHVNKTDSAVRITHLPTKTVVECQSERSQHKNKASALALLRARLLKNFRQEAIATQSALRRSIVGSGDRSERIRTYNFPQGRVTDHRINLTVHNLSEIIDGNLDGLVDETSRRYQVEELDRALAAKPE